MAIITISGNTSGSISLSAPDISGSNTLTLPVATDTLIGKATVDTLTNKSIAATQLTGTIAAAALPAGTVLQVVSAVYSTPASTATTTLVDTGLTASITPRSVSSKILVIISQNGVANNIISQGVRISLLRGASVINSPALYAYYQITLLGSVSFTTLDSPATTSATTYKTQFSRSVNNGGTALVNGDNVESSITLMEIQG